VPITWDEARIASLSDPDLLQLRDNALRKTVAELAQQCEAEISKRGLGVKVKRRAGALDPLRALENDVSTEIGAFAHHLAAKYDLSQDTATANSVGTARFKPHKLTQNNGAAKIGGLQKSGKCRLDRYASYRVQDIVISLSAFLPRNAPDDALEFQVFGPAAYISGGQSVRELRGSLADEQESKLYIWGKRFADLEEAKTCFEYVISKTVSLKKNS
jgi:hypothetical protein